MDAKKTNHKQDLESIERSAGKGSGSARHGEHPKRTGFSRSSPVDSSNRKSLAGFATATGSLAQCLRSISPLGKSGHMVSALAADSAQIFRPSAGPVHRHNHCTGSSACQWGSKKNASAEALGRSRGGLTTKIHAACIDQYTSVSFHLSEGQRSDFCGFEPVYQQIDADNVLESAALDKGYDSDAIRDKLAYDGIEPVIPPKQSRCLKPEFNKALYTQRNRIERFFNKLKNYRRVATRYDKYAASFLAFVLIASASIALKLFVNTA